MPRRYADPYLHGSQPLAGYESFHNDQCNRDGVAQFLLLGNFFYSMFRGKKVCRILECERIGMDSSVTSWTCNFDIAPVVYRGPYEYSSPEAHAIGQDFILQTVPHVKGVAKLDIMQLLCPAMRFG